MRVHRVLWAEGVHFAHGYIEDTILGHRHAADARLHAVLQTLNAGSYPMQQLAAIGLQHKLSVQELTETLQGLARRGLIVCQTRPRRLPRSGWEWRGLLYRFYALITTGYIDAGSTISIRGRAARLSLDGKGAGQMSWFVLYRAATFQLPVMITFGATIGCMTALVTHGSWFWSVVAGIVMAVLTAALHETAHAVAVARYKLPGAVVVNPYKMATIYRDGTAGQHIGISLVGPLIPLFVAGTLYASGISEIASTAMVLAAAIQLPSLLPFMKDGRAICKAVASYKSPLPTSPLTESVSNPAGPSGPK